MSKAKQLINLCTDENRAVNRAKEDAIEALKAFKSFGAKDNKEAMKKLKEIEKLINDVSSLIEK